MYRFDPPFKYFTHLNFKILGQTPKSSPIGTFQKLKMPRRNTFYPKYLNAKKNTDYR